MRTHRRRPHALRTTRLLGDMMEARIRAKRQPHHLVGPRRNTARGDHQVSVGSIVEGSAQLLRRVTCTQMSDNPPARLLHEATQQDPVRVRDLAAFQLLARTPQLGARRHHDDARARQDRQRPMPHRDRRSQRSPIQDAARREDLGTRLEGLARDTHIRAVRRGHADLDRVGCLRDAGRMVRVLDLDDRVRALGEGSARHNAHRLAGLKEVHAGVARRNVSHDRQRPRAIALQVLAAQREAIHRGIRERRQRDPRVEVDSQAAPQAFLGGKRLVREDMAERQRLNEVAVLHRGQRRIVHATSVGVRALVGWPGVGGRGRACGPGGPGALLSALAAGCGSVGRWWRAGPWLARANGGGNCSTRGATRRRHAVAVRLMVQNPPLGG